MAEFNPIEYMKAQGSVELAESNKRELRKHYLISAIFYAITAFGVFIGRPPITKGFVYTQLIGIYCFFSIKVSGSPVYFTDQKNLTKKNLVRAGEDLTQDKTVLAHFRALYITFALNVLSVVIDSPYLAYGYWLAPAYLAVLFIGGVNTHFLPSLQG